jgi:predicted O-methyltransferase YrrM
MSTTATPVTPELEAYLRPLFWREDALLQDLARDIEARGPQIQVSAEEGRLLALLVTATRARRVLEVGTLFGYSGVWMARALGPEGHLDTIEFSPMHAGAAREWFSRAGLGSQVTVHEGPALEVLPRLAGPYDLAFFDAAKAEYCDYLDHALRVVRPGGLVLADNVFWNGKVAKASDDPDVRGIRDYNARIASDPRLSSTVIPVGDGLSVSVVR